MECNTIPLAAQSVHDGEEGELAAIGDRFPFLFNSLTTIVHKSILPLRDDNRAYMHGFQRIRSNVFLVNTEF